jgi:hypothetical protein
VILHLDKIDGGGGTVLMNVVDEHVAIVDNDDEGWWRWR